MDNCKYCERPFSAKSTSQCFCSKSCSRQFYATSSNNGMNTTTVGTLKELQACADLIIKGFEVFRNVNPSGKVDLIARKQQQLLTIQVAKGTKRKDGSVFHSHLWDKNPEYAVLALVFEDGSVEYSPEVVS